MSDIERQPTTEVTVLDAALAPPTPPEDPSVLMKAHRAVTGDDRFRARMEAACWLAGVEYNETVLRRTALALAGEMHLDVFGTIDTSGVTDDMLVDAVTTVTSTATA